MKLVQLQCLHSAAHVFCGAKQWPLIQFLNHFLVFVLGSGNFGDVPGKLSEHISFRFVAVLGKLSVLQQPQSQRQWERVMSH